LYDQQQVVLLALLLHIYIKKKAPPSKVLGVANSSTKATGGAKRWSCANPKRPPLECHVAFGVISMKLLYSFFVSKAPFPYDTLVCWATIGLFRERKALFLISFFLL
jgi:hypothetical protein